MHRTIGDSYGTSSGKNIYREEDPGGAFDATQVTADALNAVQEEIARTIEAEGITLNAPGEAIGSMTQLNQAVDAKATPGTQAKTALDDAALKTVGAYNTVIPQIMAAAADMITGLTLSKNGSVGTRVDISAGACFIPGPTVGAPYQYSKDVSNYRAISNAGGANDGLPPSGPDIAIDTWYHVFICVVDSPYAADIKIDTDPGGANILAEPAWTFTRVRRIGSVRTDSIPEIRPFAQYGDEFLWNLPTLDVSSVAVPSSYPMTAYALTVPTGIEVAARLNITAVSTATAEATVYAMDGIQDPTSGGGGPITDRRVWAALGEAAHLEGVFCTNTSREIYLRNGGTGTLAASVNTIGWTDPRGRRDQ